MTHLLNVGEESGQARVPHVSRILTSEQAADICCDDILAHMLGAGAPSPCVARADFSHAFLFSALIKGRSNVEYMLDTDGGYTGLQDQETRLPVFMLKTHNRLLGYYIDEENPKISFAIEVDNSGIVIFTQERPVQCNRFNQDLTKASFYPDRPLILLQSSLKFRDVTFVSHRIDITRHFNFKNSYPVIIADQDFSGNYYELDHSKTLIL